MPDDGHNPEVRAYDRDIMGYSATSPVDGAVFYSGMSPTSGEWNWRRAQAYVAAQPPRRAATIDHTPCGQNLVAKGLSLDARRPGPVSHAAAAKVWEGASKRFALEASGRVTCFVDGARAKGTFRRAEFPALLANSQVSHVNGISTPELRNEKNAVRAFHRVEDVSRDLQPQRVPPIRTKTIAPTLAQRPLSREAAGQRPLPSTGRTLGRSR